eukprot:TRINITY_DN1448_c0_g1_i2.p1 TRINITY_DN1448_c0_g1~~TRINITY_DN1448_c0_g1_i2.p1  ORF type:complete len:264 (-),score=63.43 TRINITY_DN1448_c0_g1_i2:12-803(-)
MGTPESKLNHREKQQTQQQHQPPTNNTTPPPQITPSHTNESLSSLSANDHLSSVPYTSYSFEKSPTPLTLPPVVPFTSTNSSFITVATNTTNTQTQDPEVEAVLKIPSFQPILKGNPSLPPLSEKLSNEMVLGTIEPRAFMAISAEYQMMYSTSSKRISDRQSVLCIKIRELENSIGRNGVYPLTNKVTEFKHYDNQLKELLRFFSWNIEHTKNTLLQAITLTEKLLALLPDEEKDLSFFESIKPNESSSNSNQKSQKLYYNL